MKDGSSGKLEEDDDIEDYQGNNEGPSNENDNDDDIYED